MDIYIDTDKMRDAAKEINILIEDLYNNYESLFSTFANINSEKNYWVGKSATKFITTAETEKEEYFKYVSNLKYYSEYLIKQADYIDNNIGRLRK